MYLLKHFTYILVSVLIERVTFFHQVVELLIAKGANFEHRNVSDYTPLSLAASGGYVGIIKLLLSHGAEINSRTHPRADESRQNRPALPRAIHQCRRVGGRRNRASLARRGWQTAGD